MLTKTFLWNDLKIEKSKINVVNVGNGTINVSIVDSNKENAIKISDLIINVLNKEFEANENFLILLSKLEGLKNLETEFDFYRKTVFESKEYSEVEDRILYLRERNKGFPKHIKK